MEQLVFELAAPEPPSFDNFLPVTNAELVTVLAQFASGTLQETGVLLWGASGAGKSHLLQAVVQAAVTRGYAATYLAHPADLTAACIDTGLGIVAVDRIDEADASAQGLAFTLYNAQKERGSRVIAASRQPLAAMSVREDLRTRLGWGLVYEVLALRDDQKPAALEAYALKRGFRLGDDVIEYLLRHGRRDMPSLLATLAALDRQSLSSKRPITVQLLRSWLQRDLEWNTQKHDPLLDA